MTSKIHAGDRVIIIGPTKVHPLDTKAALNWEEDVMGPHRGTVTVAYENHSSSEPNSFHLTDLEAQDSSVSNYGWYDYWLKKIN